MLYLYLWIKNWLKADKGQDLVEYAMLLAFIALIVIVALRLAGPAINTVWNNIVTALQAI